MAWFAELAGKAEELLNNLDAQTGEALRNHILNTTALKQQKKGDPTEYAQHQHPEPLWNSRRKPLNRSLPRKSQVEPYRYSSAPINRNPSPTSSLNTAKNKRITNKNPPKIPQSNQKHFYSLNNCPKTMVDDGKTDDFADIYHYKNAKRSSVPNDFDTLSVDDVNIRMENLEVENSMLKNELSVVNREITELLERLRKTEDELVTTNSKLERKELMYVQVNTEKEASITEAEKFKNQVDNLLNTEIPKYKEENLRLETEVSKLKDRILEFEELTNKLREQAKEKEAKLSQLDADLRHAQSTIDNLTSNLGTSNGERKRLEKEWDMYRHRVKSMLTAKDKEIKSLKHGLHFDEETRALVDQIASIKLERDVLSEAVARIRGECHEMKQYLDSLEKRNSNSERLIIALRDAIRDEKAARSRVETQYHNVTKEMKCFQLETEQLIGSLQSALREKERELFRLRASPSASNATSSALNVGDYTNNVVSRDHSDEKEQIYFLTQKLVQRQARIDTLQAENNIIKIQLNKLEAEVQARKSALKPHSTVNVQEQSPQDAKSRYSILPGPLFYTIASHVRKAWRRIPVWRTSFIIYMVCLHILVVIVLLASTPDTLNRASYYRNFPMTGMYN